MKTTYRSGVITNQLAALCSKGELLFLLNRVTPVPNVITRTRRTAVQAASLPPVTPSIKSECDRTASYFGDCRQITLPKPDGRSALPVPPTTRSPSISFGTPTPCRRWPTRRPYPRLGPPEMLPPDPRVAAPRHPSLAGAARRPPHPAVRQALLRDDGLRKPRARGRRFLGNGRDSRLTLRL